MCRISADSTLYRRLKSCYVTPCRHLMTKRDKPADTAAKRRCPCIALAKPHHHVTNQSEAAGLCCELLAHQPR